MKPKWRLRPALESDAPELQRIERACFGEPWTLALLNEALRDPKYLLLCAQELAGVEPEGGSLLGYATAWSVLDEGQLDRLAVLPEQRRSGVGRALLAGILSKLQAAGAASVFLEVRASNAGALELYRRVGFVEAGRRKGYYENGEDALILRFEHAG